MAEVNVKNLKAGTKIMDPVRSSVGGIIFPKNHVIKVEDIDILKAFLIEIVSVAGASSEKGKGVKEDSKKPSEESETESKGAAEKPSLKSKQANKEKPEEKVPGTLQEEYELFIAKTDTLFQEIRNGLKPSLIQTQHTLMSFMNKAMKKPSFIIRMPLNSEIDNYLSHHAVSVASLSTLIGKAGGYASRELGHIALAGYFHNIGNLRIDTRLLFKPTRLTKEEFEEIQRHTAYGYQILKALPSLPESVTLAALQHHEREDGSGYPFGFKSNKIHPFAKIVAIADMFHAMCAKRAHKASFSPFFAIEQLKNDSFGKLDPKFVILFQEMVTGNLSIGTKVVLNNDEQGEIVFIDRNMPTRPVIECSGEVIDLQRLSDVHIKEILN